MLSEFIKWAESISLPASQELIATVTLNESCDNRSARLDIDTSKAIAKIVLWESGYYSAEIINVDSETVTYSHQGVLNNADCLPEQFKSFIDAISK